MASNVDVVARWQRKSLWYGEMPSWGGAAPTTDLLKCRDTSGAVMRGDKELVRMADNVGHGKPYPQDHCAALGRAFARGNFTLPLTQQVFRDFMILLWQGNITDNATYHTIDEYEEAGIDWTACLYGKIVHGLDSFYSGWEAESCFPTSIAITIPQSSGESPAICEAAISFLGRSCERQTTDQTYALIAGGENVADPFLGHLVQMAYGATNYGLGTWWPFLNASITLTNGGVLSPEGDDNGYSPRAIKGLMGASGSLTVWMEESKWAKELQENREDKTIEYIYFRFNADHNDIRIPVVITNVGEPTDVMGATAFSFDFELMGDSGGTKTPRANVLADAGNSDDSPWMTP